MTRSCRSCRKGIQAWEEGTKQAVALEISRGFGSCATEGSDRPPLRRGRAHRHDHQLDGSPWRRTSDPSADRDDKQACIDRPWHRERDRHAYVHAAACRWPIDLPPPIRPPYRATCIMHSFPLAYIGRLRPYVVSIAVPYRTHACARLHAKSQAQTIYVDSIYVCKDVRNRVWNDPEASLDMMM